MVGDVEIFLETCRPVVFIPYGVIHVIIRALL